MGLFDKKENKEENEIIEINQDKEIDKLKNYMKDQFGVTFLLYNPLIKIIDKYYEEGISDYKKCISFIDLCNKHVKELLLENNTIEMLYHLCMNFEITNILFNLINMILNLGSNRYNYIKYMQDSRAYFSDNETWYARVYEVINNPIDVKTALEEDKMRIGIYPNITNKEVEELSKKLDSVRQMSNFVITNTERVHGSVNELKDSFSTLEKDAIEKIDSTYKASIKEIQNFTNDSINMIKRILNTNPNSKEEILKEIEKQINVIDAFDENVNIKERYDKLISLKNKTIIYHPKFNEVLKYVLAGNTVCLTGPNKCGKTNLVKQLASLLNLSFNNLGNINDEVTGINGYYDFNTNYNKTRFQNVFENGGLLLIKNIDNSPIEVVNTLNNIISNFSYNPHIFGDKLLTTPSKNFRLIMTNNNGFKVDRSDIDNLVNINLDYDTNFENSLTKDKKILDFLHELRNNGLNITTSTFVDIISHLELGLFSIEELLNNYIIQNNSVDLLNRTTEKISQDNNYNNTLKKILKG